MTHKTMYTLSAAAVAGVAVFQFKRLVRHWRRTHLNFDFPMEDQLFIGWGGSVPKHRR